VGTPGAAAAASAGAEAALVCSRTLFWTLLHGAMPAPASPAPLCCFMCFTCSTVQASNPPFLLRPAAHSLRQRRA
jgi:hypothetical protein